MYPWLGVSLLVLYSLRKSCPTQGWHHWWEIKEHGGLWLGGMLQQCSWLWSEVFIRLVILSIFTSATIFTINDMMNMLNECLCECMLIQLCMINNYNCVWYTIALVHVLLQCIVFQHSVSAILCMYMLMGLLARVVRVWVTSSSWHDIGPLW